MILNSVNQLSLYAPQKGASQGASQKHLKMYLLKLDLKFSKFKSKTLNADCRDGQM